VFVRDRLTGSNELVSVDSLGGQGNNFSWYSSISPDGRFVSFSTAATNLVAGDVNGSWDILVHDRLTGRTELASVDSAGNQGNDDSLNSAVSSGGLFVAFDTESSNLVPGDVNGSYDVFVREHACHVGEPYCFGDGSALPCPCANEGLGVEGCANSSGSGGALLAQGSASAASDDLVFDATQLVAGQPALLFAGQAALAGGDGVPFGDGLQCAGGGVVRLGATIPNASGTAAWGPGLGATGGWSAGDVRYFQVWYRDPSPPGPCGSGFNLTNGVEVSFEA
jgi:hypothetical protein